MNACDDPHCPCQMADRNGQGWRYGNANAPKVTCGTATQYQKGCRCRECKAAAAAYRKKMRDAHRQEATT